MKRIFVLICFIGVLFIAWGCTTNKEPKPIDDDKDNPITLVEANQTLNSYFDDYNDLTLDNDDFFADWSNDLSAQIDEYYTRRSIVHINNFNFGFKYLGEDTLIFRRNGLHFEDFEREIILVVTETINVYSDQLTFDAIILFDAELFLLEEDGGDQQPQSVKEIETYAMFWRNSNDAIQVHVLIPPVPITDSWATPRGWLNLTETETVLEMFLDDLTNPDIHDWEIANQYFLGVDNYHFSDIREMLIAGGYVADLLHILDPFSLDGLIPFEVVITYDDPGGEFEQHDILSILIELYDEGHYHINVYCELPDLPHYQEPEEHLDAFLEKFNNPNPDVDGCDDYFDWTELGDCRRMQQETTTRGLEITHHGCTPHTAGGHSVCEVSFNIGLGDAIYTSFSAYVYFHGDATTPYMTFYPANFWHQVSEWFEVYDYFTEANDTLNDSTLPDVSVCDVYGFLFHDCIELRSLLLESHIVGIVYHSLDNTYSIHWQFDMLSSDTWYYHVTIEWMLTKEPLVLFKSAIVIP